MFVLSGQLNIAFVCVDGQLNDQSARKRRRRKEGRKEEDTSFFHSWKDVSALKAREKRKSVHYYYSLPYAGGNSAGTYTLYIVTHKNKKQTNALFDHVDVFSKFWYPYYTITIQYCTPLTVDNKKKIRATRREICMHLQVLAASTDWSIILVHTINRKLLIANYSHFSAGKLPR